MKESTRVLLALRAAVATALKLTGDLAAVAWVARYKTTAAAEAQV